jgi:uridine phosphorylase
VPTASYPNFAGKHAGQALFTAADFIAYQRQVGAMDDREIPGGVVLCYHRSLYDHVLGAEGLKPPRRRDLPVPLPSTGGHVGLVGQFGFGAPVATVVLENLAALGISAMVSVGTAGSLQRDLEPGDLVLCKAAVRDEGVSHHYLPPARLAAAPTEMTAALGTTMRQSGLAFRTGVSWTIDTPYRETVAEAQHYQAEGVLCVEMEAAALFAVAEVRDLRLASAFVISDSLAELVWNPRLRDPAVQAGLIDLYQAAVAALLAVGKSLRRGRARHGVLATAAGAGGRGRARSVRE